MPSIRRFQRPGPKSLDALNATTAQKGRIRFYLNGYMDDKRPGPHPVPLLYAKLREEAGVNRPSARVSNEEALHAIAGVLDTSVGSLDIEGARTYTDDGVRMCPPFSMVEMGDPYTPTLARDHARGAWVVAPWADLAEEYEKEHELGDYAPGAQDDEENY